MRNRQTVCSVDFNPRYKSSGASTTRLGKQPALLFMEGGLAKKLSCTVAVAENPLDGATADELILKASELIRELEQKGGNLIGYK